MRMQKPLCFVIMGFGKKTDPSNGITYDLNKTYQNIIKPTVIRAGYECIRADEIKDSGLIDRSMYALLMYADLVIADITTYNPNAVYELGIRHAVRPYSTIILKEREGKIPFDIDHTRIFKYSHLGEDIGVDESERCKQELITLIDSISKAKEIDSPLYTYIKGITPPILTKEEYLEIINELAKQEKYIFALVEKAKEAMIINDFVTASKYWEKANTQVSNEPYFIQQKALCVYKSKKPTENLALIDALKIIGELDPDGNTNDPETLGISGAIYKQLWHLNRDNEYLERAIKYYGKCYNIRNDYYTGENYALCLSLKESIEKNEEEMIFAKVLAKNVRNEIIRTLSDVVNSENFDTRVDKKWIVATLSHCYFAIGDLKSYKEYEDLFLNENPLDWEKDTYYNNNNILKKIIKE